MRNLSLCLVAALLLAAGVGVASAHADGLDPGISGVVTPRFTQPPSGDLTTNNGTPPLTDHDSSGTREHVMPSNTVYTIFWNPTGSGYTFSANYISLINGFLQNVAAASGALTNVYASDTQYGAGYSTTFGGTYTDTSTAFPASGCSDSHTSLCLDDAQLQTEITSVMTSQSWTRSPTKLYFIFTPNGVGSCENAGPRSSSNACSYSDYCGYHSAYGTYASPVIYANMPYAALTGFTRCLSGQSPNGDDADSTINVLSHEHNESITDPYLLSWMDSSGYENGDECAWVFGSSLGGASGARYNQVINGAHYYLQLEWSNSDSGCVQDMTDPVNTVVPTLSGSNQNGLAMSASNGTWTNTVFTYSSGSTWANSTPTYAYQWQRCDSAGSNCVNVSGATSSSYTFGNADVGTTFRVGVSGSVGHTTSPSWAYSLASAVVGQMARPSSGTAPVISGTTQVGSTLSTTNGTWTSNVTPTYTYQWRRCDSSGNNCVDISSATSSSYVLAAADLGMTIQVGVYATNPGGTTGPFNSAPTSVISGTATPVNTVPPSISGTAQVGQSLTAGQGTWTSSTTPTYAYQWRRCDVNGNSCGDIAGATGTSYAVMAADMGSALRVGVSATNSGGTTGPVYSAATAAVPQIAVPVNTGAPQVSGTPAAGGTLTATAGAWTSVTTPSYTYQWQRCDTGGNGCVAIAAATASTYVVASTDLGGTLRVAVTAHNEGGSAGPYYSSSISLLSAPTNTVAPALDGSTVVGSTLAVSNGSWTSASSLTYGYQWESCDTSGLGCVPIVGASAATYTVQSTDLGRTLLAVVTATASGGSTSASSGATSVVTPASSGGGGGGGGGSSGGGGGGTPAPVATPTPTAPAPVATPTPAAAPVATPAPAPARVETTAAPVLAAVAPLPAVTLSSAHPAVTLTATLTERTTLQLTLVDAKGHVVGRWSKVEKPGKVTLSLALPTDARKVGHDTLKVTAAGKTKTVPVVFKA